MGEDPLWMHRPRLPTIRKWEWAAHTGRVRETRVASTTRHFLMDDDGGGSAAVDLLESAR